MPILKRKFENERFQKQQQSKLINRYMGKSLRFAIFCEIFENCQLKTLLNLIFYYLNNTLLTPIKITISA